MPPKSTVYVAGVGFSPSPPEGSPTKAVIASLVSAATKALLDAGVTYDDVTHGVRSVKSKAFRYGSEAFEAFEEGGITVDEVQSGSELDSSFDLVRDQGVQCVLMIAIEKVCL